MGIEKDIKQFEAGKGRETTQEERLGLIQKHVTHESMVKHPSSHFVYKNIMTKDDKKDSKFIPYHIIDDKVDKLNRYIDTKNLSFPTVNTNKNNEVNEIIKNKNDKLN